ncbi:OmpH family outer membrane protein [Pelagibacteraceae bacterium]|nr:OmpH family outer membrane protein [Pelagibacteraceae bacterium]
MKFIYLIIFLYFNLLSSTILAQNIATVNLQYLIDSNSQYIEIIKKIENSQIKYLESFDLKEQELENILKDIENSKLILNENEINTKIENYNQQLKNFNDIVDDFNFHYKNQIINIRESILMEIVALLEKYAMENQIDLILDSTSYLIASNTLDISETIKNELLKIKFQLEYKDFE